MEDDHQGDMEAGTERLRGAVTHPCSCCSPADSPQCIFSLYSKTSQNHLLLFCSVPLCLSWASSDYFSSKSSPMPPISCDGCLLWDPIVLSIIYDNRHRLLGITVVCALLNFPFGSKQVERTNGAMPYSYLYSHSPQSVAYSVKV